MYADPRVITDQRECFFYHSMDLPGVGEVKGQWDLRGDFDKYIGHVELAGSRVLDVGSGSGFLSYSAESAGAAEVVSFDMDHASRQHWVPFIQNASYFAPEQHLLTHNKWVEAWKNGYWFAHRLLNSKSKAIYGDVYDIPASIGKFDVVLVCSILEHLANPVRALASIAKAATSLMVITTPIIESNERIARFEPTAGRPAIDFVWWTYSVGLYREVLEILGFSIVHMETNKFRFVLRDSLETRTTIVARRIREIPVGT